MTGITRKQVAEAWERSERLQAAFEKLHPNAVRYRRAKDAYRAAYEEAVALQEDLDTVVSSKQESRLQRPIWADGQGKR